MNEHEINRSAARPQDFDAAEAVRNYNERKKGVREIAREAVAKRPPIDLETRVIPPTFIATLTNFVTRISMVTMRGK